MEPDKVHCKTAKQQYWRNHISCWKGSGLTQREYCFAQGIAISTFSYWIRKYGKGSKNSKPPRFYPLAVRGDSTLLEPKRLQAGIRLSLCNDKYKIDLENEFSETTLKKLIVTLETI